ncbi:cupin domain-containing protein [Candidatus Bathyarchaeota archaeon]|nr:cupin domain-containing protein [Candidatus Bathyarchaeota archaeon]
MKVFRLKDLVDYQEGAIVSRTLIDKKAGTVTLFAFDENQGLSEHTAPYDAMVTILEGRAEIILGGEPLNLEKGDTVIMPANVPHAVKAKGKFKMLLVMIREAT